MNVPEEETGPLAFLPVFQGRGGGGNERVGEVTQKLHSLSLSLPFSNSGKRKNSRNYSRHVRIITGCLLFICKECQAGSIEQARGRGIWQTCSDIQNLLLIQAY